jgi:autotransporter-associated beta strand protein
MYTGVTAIGRNGSLSLAGSAGIALSSGLVDNGVFDIAATSAGASVQSLSGSGILQLGGQTLTLTNARDTFAGVISGVGGLALSSGNETLSGTNTYTGATTIGRNGSLSLSGAGAIALSSRVEDDGVFDIAATTNGAKVQSLSGAGAVLLGGQTLTLTNAHDTFAGGIRGSGGLAIAAGNAMLTGANGGFTGTTTVAAGALLALSGAGSIAGSALRDDGVFDVTAATASNVGLKSLSGSGSVLLGSHDLTLSQAGGNFSGTIAGSGNLRVTGGKLVLGGTNTYAGKTIVSGATLQTTAAANLGSGSSALELDNGTWQTSATLTHERGLLLSGKGTVDVDAATVTTENGAVTGAGKLVKQGTGTLVLRGVLGNGGGVQVDKGMLTLTAANTYSGDTTVATGGVLRIDSDANLGAAGNKLTLDGGTLQTTTTMASARAVTLTEKTGTFDTEGASSVVTLDGNVTGAGRLVKEGAGTLVLAGDNAGGQGSANKPGDGWTGGLTINDGLVKVTNAYGLGWGSVLTFNSGTIYAAVDIATGQNIRMGNSTSIDTAAGTVTTLAGDMLSTGAGNGCFTKTGLGTLNVTGAANIDSTCVMQGKLLANGYFSSKVTVAQGATLGGSGTVKGDVLVQGTLSPGNSPGMLTADSNITMAKGSTYKEDIGGSVQASGTSPVGAPGYYSYLNVVNGKRFVIEQGATLAPTLKGLYSVNEPGYGSAPVVPQLGQTYRIVTADGGVVGRFDTLVQPEGQDGTRFAAFYNLGGSKSIELKVLPASYATWLKDGNAGSRSAAVALDRIADLDQSGQGSERQAALLYQAASYDAAKLGGLVQGLSGQVHGALAAATPQAGWDLQRSVLKHGSDTNGRALWLDITGSRGKWSSDGGAAGFHADRVQVTAGVDVYASRDEHLGFGASHAMTDLSPEGGSGKLRQNKVFVYGDTAINGMVFDAIGAYGRDKGDTSRSDPFLTSGAALRTAADGHSTLLGAGVRTEREFGGTKIEPFARVNVQKVERDGASEGSVSSAALELAGYSATGTRLVAGLSAASRNSDPLQGSTYRFNLGAGVDTGSLVRANQQASLAGVTMTVAAPDVGRAFLQGSVTGTLQLKKGAYLYLGVTGEARNGYYQLGGNAGVRAVF